MSTPVNVITYTKLINDRASNVETKVNHFVNGCLKKGMIHINQKSSLIRHNDKFV